MSMQQAAIGASRIQLMDIDVVDETNVATQGHRQRDVGRRRRRRLVRSIPPIEFDLVPDRFPARLAIGEPDVCCVDSIAAREAISTIVPINAK